MPDTPPDSRIEKWRRWLDPRIDTEILTMHAHRDVYLKVVEITQQHGSLPPSHFFDYLASWYGTTQTAAIRRQADTNPRVVSLARLMTEIKDDPTRITRDWFLAQYDDLAQPRGEMTWQIRFGGAVGEHIRF